MKTVANIYITLITIVWTHRVALSATAWPRDILTVLVVGLGAGIIAQCAVGLSITG
jgi:hypothetical protein